MAVGSLTNANAQRPEPPPPGGERIEALYIAYISKELQLTEAEAQKFWPVHSEFDAEMRAIHGRTSMSELDKEQELLNTKKKYSERFSKILGNPRTDKFYRIDAEFKKKLVERLRKMREQRGNKGPIRGGRPPL
jgi:hypothetical protein